jgi:hypothetical protein
MAATYSRKAGPGRAPGFKHAPQSKDAMRVARLETLLEKHAAARVALMEPSQVTAALGLLKKYKPDLAAVTLQGDPNKPLTIITRAE